MKRIQLASGKELLLDTWPYPERMGYKEHWKLWNEGSYVRYLDEFESEFVNATIRAMRKELQDGKADSK